MTSRLSTLALAAALLAGAAPAGAATAEPPLLRKFCPTGEGAAAVAGKCSIPRGIGVDAASGDVYVADQNNERIEKFSAWGDVLRAWGWDVVVSGPDNTAANRFEVCVAGEDVCKNGLSGGGAGEFNGTQGVAVDSVGDVYVVDRNNRRVQKFGPEGEFLLTFGGGVISGGATGSGNLSEGSKTIAVVATTSKAFEVGQTIEGAGIPADTQIEALGAGTIAISKAATASGPGVALSAPEGAGNVPTNERQTVTLGANTTGGSFALSFTTPNPSASSATATEIPYNATAAQLQEKLEAMSNLGAGNVAVSGAAGGPWTVEFKGTRFADTDVAQMSATPSGLEVSSGTKEVKVATFVHGASAGRSAASRQTAGRASRARPSTPRRGSSASGASAATSQSTAREPPARPTTSSTSATKDACRSSTQAAITSKTCPTPAKC